MQYAPKPKRQGTLQAAVVEVVASMGGATAEDIRTYLPTVYEPKRTKKQIETALSNAVNRGYLISDQLTGSIRKYRRAPLEYYQARNKRVRAMQRKSRRKVMAKKATTKPVQRKAEEAPQKLSSLPDFDRVRMTNRVDRETAITWALVTLVGGLGIGLALGSLL